MEVGAFDQKGNIDVYEKGHLIGDLQDKDLGSGHYLLVLGEMNRAGVPRRFVVVWN